jgi:hypothetical protein
MVPFHTAHLAPYGIGADCFFSRQAEKVQVFRTGFLVLVLPRGDKPEVTAAEGTTCATTQI